MKRKEEVFLQIFKVVKGRERMEGASPVGTCKNIFRKKYSDALGWSEVDSYTGKETAQVISNTL